MKRVAIISVAVMRTLPSSLWSPPARSRESASISLPGFIGLGTDVPRGVAEQWSRWCKHPRYFFSTHPHYERALARFDGPLRAVSFSDDWYAPRKNVDWLLAQYRAEQVEHEHLTPYQVGANAVGHFGFFSKRFAATLWPRVPAFVGQVLEPSSAHVAA